MFRVPTDPIRFKKWKQAIPKREKELTVSSYVCAKHFKDDEIITEWTSGEGDSQVRVS